MGFGKDGKGAMLRQHQQMALATLANDAGIILGTKPPINDDFRMLKWEGVCTIENCTNGEAGALSLWMVDGDLSLAEAMAALDSNAPTDLNDNPGEAVASRFVKLIAVLVGDTGDERTFIGRNGSPVLELPIRWTFASTKSFNFLIVNDGDQLTTGCIVNLRGTAFGVFIR